MNANRTAVETGVDAYHVGEAVPVSGFDAVPAGTNVLVSGGPMLGKRRIALEMLAAGAPPEHAIAVSPDTDARRLHRAYDDVPGSERERLHVVDCTGTAGSGSVERAPDVQYVSSPGDLTGIGVGIVKATRDIGPDAEAGLRLSILSLSTVARYTDAQRAFNFLHTVTGRVAAADYLGVATVDPSTHAPEELSTITSLFDTMVELRETDDGSREVRVVGHPDSPRTWQPF